MQAQTGILTCGLEELIFKKVQAKLINDVLKSDYVNICKNCKPLHIVRFKHAIAAKNGILLNN